jgi:hypothetical protein
MMANARIVKETYLGNKGAQMGLVPVGINGMACKVPTIGGVYKVEIAHGTGLMWRCVL